MMTLTAREGIKMAINFANVNLEVIDINTNASPDIFVNKNGVTFTKRVLEDLNYPQNVQYCIDPENHVFAIKPCKGNEVKATSFSKPRGEQNSTVSCNNKNMHAVLTRMIPDYDEEKRYKITGFFDTENKIMYYDMSEAEESLFRAAK